MAGGSLWEYYDALDALVVDLRHAEHHELSRRLDDAKSGGSTSGEILSGSRGVLREIVKVDDPDLRRRARDLERWCSRLWRDGESRS